MGDRPLSSAARGLARTVPLACLVVDADALILAASARFERLTGRAGPDLLGRPWTSLVAVAPEPPLDPALAGPAQRGAVDLVRADGSWLAARVESAPVEIGLPGAALVSFFPVSAAPYVPGTSLLDVLDRVGDGFMAMDTDWRIVHLNRSAEEFLGQARGDLVGRPLWEAFPALAGSEVETAFRGAAAGAGPVEFELRGPVLRRWTKFRAYPSAGGLSISFRDDTARKVAEERLHASETRYRAVFENTLDGLVLATSVGQILSANPAACRLLLRTEAELRGLGRTGVVHPEEARLSAFIEERRRTGHAEAELLLMRGDGTTFLAGVRSTLFTDADGEALTTLSIRDLTERKRAEDALHLLDEASARVLETLDYEETLRAVARMVVPRLADLCVVDVLEAGRLRRAAIQTGDRATTGPLPPGALPPDGPTGVGVGRVISTGQPEVVPVVTDEWLRAQAQTDEQFEFARTVGATSVIVVPLVARGTTVGVLSLARLGGERRYGLEDLPLARALADRAALALDNARMHAASVAATRHRDEMLAIVSHDLRNPLNAIALSARVLAKKLDSPLLAGIKAAAERANRLVEDLLLTAVIESGKLSVSRQPVDVSPVLEETIALHRPIAEEKQLTLVLDVEAGLPRVLLDRHRLGQAVSNLLGNAIQFTPEGGKIEVRARATPDALEIALADTGPGIPPEMLAHLFDRFWQGAHAHRAGAGLGLAITRGIVDAHGGTITVASEPGQGATFRITLPR